jgi:hypothetical protein
MCNQHLWQIFSSWLPKKKWTQEYFVACFLFSFFLGKELPIFEEKIGKLEKKSPYV